MRSAFQLPFACDGEKGNPSDVEGVGSISTDVATPHRWFVCARSALCVRKCDRQMACAAPSSYRGVMPWSAPRASFLVQEPYGRGANRAQWRRNGTMQSLFHVDIPPGQTTLFDAGERTMVLHRAGLDLLQHLEGRNAAQLPYHVLPLPLDCFHAPRQFAAMALLESPSRICSSVARSTSLSLAISA